jgi:hypothetical protein
MSKTDLFKPYIGKKTNDVIDAMNALAAKNGLRVALMGDPKGPFHNIDVENDRLNVWAVDGRIVKISQG